MLLVHYKSNILNCIFGILCFQHFCHHRNQLTGIGICLNYSIFFLFEEVHCRTLNMHQAHYMSCNHIDTVYKYQLQYQDNVFWHIHRDYFEDQLLWVYQYYIDHKLELQQLQLHWIPLGIEKHKIDHCKCRGFYYSPYRLSYI